MRMERFRCLPTERVLDDSSDEVREWIPTREEFLQVYKYVRRSCISDKPLVDRTPFAPEVEQPEVCDIILTSRRIGKRTFIEGCFDAVLLQACWVGNVPVVNYLLTKYMQYFSIDTLIDKVSTRFRRGPVCYESKGMANFRQLESDKVSLLHAAAEGLQLDVIKLLLSAGANVNNSSKWLISPLISALTVSGLGRELQRTVTGLIDLGANINYRDADGMTPLMYASMRPGVASVQMLIKAGANPRAMDSEGFTALHHACMMNRTTVIEYLLKIAPDLLLLRGKPSLACLAPYLGVFETRGFHLLQMFVFIRQTGPSISKVFLDIPICPSAIKFDINMLRVVHEVMTYRRYSNIPRALDVLKKLIASDIDPVIEANGGVPVSYPRDIAKEKYQLALLKRIKSMDPTSRAWDRKLIQQCYLVSLSCYAYSSVPMISMLFHHLSCLEEGSSLDDYSSLLLVEELSRMICFRLDTIQYICLSQTSLTNVLWISERFIDFACNMDARVLLNLAIDVFCALVNSLEKVTTKCTCQAHDVLHSCSKMMFDALVSVDSEKETAVLMAKFAKCNPPLLFNTSEGYPETLLHVALSSQGMLTSPLLQTFLHSGGDRWINTPGVNGRRPLHHHIPKNVEVLLIDCGAHLDAVDADGSTPECCNEYLKYNASPLSCIAARSIVQAGGLREYKIGILPAHVQAFISLHDGHATRAEVGSVLLNTAMLQEQRLSVL